MLSLIIIYLHSLQISIVINNYVDFMVNPKPTTIIKPTIRNIDLLFSSVSGLKNLQFSKMLREGRKKLTVKI